MRDESLKIREEATFIELLLAVIIPKTNLMSIFFYLMFNQTASCLLPNQINREDISDYKDAHSFDFFSI